MLVPKRLFSHFKPLGATLLLGALAVFPGTADSASSAWEETEQTKVRMIAGTAGVGEDRELRLGLQFQMKPGWKIYWRSPGDAGFPPNVKWNGSRNLAAADLQWPAPLRFSVLGLETLGYKKEVVFPVAAKVVTSGQAAEIKARVRYLTCDDICIPYEANLSLSVPPGDAGPSEHAHLIDKFRASVPGDGSAHGLKIDALHSVTDAKGAKLQVLASTQTAFGAPDIYFEGAPGLAYSKPTVTMLDGGTRALIDVTVDGLDGLDDEKGQTLDNRTFVATLVDGMRSAEQSLVAQPGAPPASLLADTTGGRGGVSFITILLLAILGGLILNLMPCVLPVLSLKLLGLVQHGGGDPKEARQGFLASAAGIIFAFLVLAGSLAALKAGGMAVGWGIQFQQPWFLVGMAVLITLFACNLWGFFEVRLPQAVSDAGLKAGNASGLGGHFLQGSFATLLATPCSAPFLGTAVGFALAGGTADIFAVFAALGVGLALPYLLIAAFPRTATWLPKPGPWMVKLKVVLGFALAATGVWILTVLAGTAGSAAAWVAAALMVFAGAALYWAHKPGGAGYKVSLPALLAAFFVATAAPAVLPEKAQTASADGTTWQPFDEAAIPRLVAEGKTIYVDVTADWCITCLVNKGVVLGDQQVKDLFASGKVIAMQADWTKPSDAISKYLARYGRYGIPFNIVYGPKSPEGVVLPELLSAGLVLNAIGTAGGEQILTAGK